MWMLRGRRRGRGSVDGVEVEGGGKRDEAGGSSSGRYVEGHGASIGCKRRGRW